MKLWKILSHGCLDLRARRKVIQQTLKVQKSKVIFFLINIKSQKSKVRREHVLSAYGLQNIPVTSPLLLRRPLPAEMFFVCWKVSFLFSSALAIDAILVLREDFSRPRPCQRLRGLGHAGLSLEQRSFPTGRDTSCHGHSGWWQWKSQQQVSFGKRICCIYPVA